MILLLHLLVFGIVSRVEVLVVLSDQGLLFHGTKFLGGSLSLFVEVHVSVVHLLTSETRLQK